MMAILCLSGWLSGVPIAMTEAGSAGPLAGSEATQQRQDRGRAKPCFFSHPI